MKKITISLFTICLIYKTDLNAQKSCADKIADAKSITMTIARGNATKSNEDALTAVLIRLSIDCPDEQREFNKWVQNLDDPANKRIKSNVPVAGTYQSVEERERIAKERMDQLGKPFSNKNGGAGNYDNQNTQKNNRNNNNTKMVGDGYAELPFKEGDDAEENSGIRNNSTNNTAGDGDWIDTKKTIRKSSNGLGVSGKAFENEKQNEQYKNQAHNQIQNGKGGFKPAENEGDLIKPNLNLNDEIKNFENKLLNIPENQRATITAKANNILNSESNPNEAARKLSSLMKEFEEFNSKTGKNKLNVNNSNKTTEYEATTANATINDYYINFFKNKGFSVKITSYIDSGIGRRFFLASGRNSDFQIYKNKYFEIISSNPYATQVRSDEYAVWWVDNTNH